MPVPSEILALIDQLNQELDQTLQQATEGLNLVRPALSRFPDNIILTQFFAYLNNVLFFVENYRVRVQGTVTSLSVADVTTEEIRETGEELATMLGVVLETKMRVGRIIARLEELP